MSGFADGKPKRDKHEREATQTIDHITNGSPGLVRDDKLNYDVLAQNSVVLVEKTMAFTTDTRRLFS